MASYEEILNEGAGRCSINPPLSWVRATRQEQLILKGCLEDTAEDLLDRFDIDGLTTFCSVYRDIVDGTEYGPDPQNQGKLARRLARGEDAVRYVNTGGPTLIERGLECDYLAWVEAGNAPNTSTRFYITNDNQIVFWNATTDPVIAKWVQKSWRRPSRQSDPSQQMDDDEVIFPRRVMVSGCVWRFRERHGLDFGTERLNYENLAKQMADDSVGKTTYKMGGSGFDPDDEAWKRTWHGDPIPLDAG